MPYYSTKTYTAEEGLSCCFRQWRATHSHCSLLHGYALSFKIVFGCETLDDRNWVQDFGGLKELKQWLKDTFDHTLVISADDPQLDYICSLSGMGIAEVLVLEDGVGCEKFAKLVHDYAETLVKHQSNGRVWVSSVECREHGGNSAIYEV